MPDIFVSKEKKTRQSKSLRVRNKPSLAKSPPVNSKLGKKERQARLDLVLGKEVKERFGHKNNHPLRAFCYYPEKVKFINEDPEEEIILLLRRHPITNLRWILSSLAFLIAPAFLTVLPLFEQMPFDFKLVSVLVWYLLVFAFTFEKFLGWFFNINIVTDERIVEVDFVNLIYRELTDANIDQIQDVTVQVGGGIRTFFNYGNVQIQTAAEIPQIDFESIPEPDKVAKVLRELRVEEEVEKLEGRVR